MDRQMLVRNRYGQKNGEGQVNKGQNLMEVRLMERKKDVITS